MAQAARQPGTTTTASENLARSGNPPAAGALWVMEAAARRPRGGPRHGATMTTTETRPSDAELMAATRAGDREAFARLVERHKDRLVGYLGRLTGCPEEARDLAQETFVRLFQSADRYREEGHLEALLYRIATNLLRSQRRRERRFATLRPWLAARDNGHDPNGVAAVEERLLAEEAQRELARALAELPLDFRVPLVLHEMEEWSYAEIARHLGCREGTVKSRIHRGRRRLKEKLAPYRAHRTSPGQQPGEEAP